MTRAAIGGALLVLLPTIAAAQIAAPDALDPTADATQAPPASQGPMTVERIHNGFLIAPEVKATEFDRRAFPLVGASAGFVAQQTFFIGGGGYWLPSQRTDDRRLAYGGAIFRWFIADSSRFGFSVGTLLGGGEATVPETVTQVIYPTLDPRTVRNPPPAALPQPQSVTATVRVRNDFVVAEPEVSARVALAPHVRLTVGAGYRFAGTDWRHRGGFDDDASRRLSGATATFGVQIGS